MQPIPSSNTARFRREPASERLLLGSVVALLLLHPVSSYLYLPALSLLKHRHEASAEAVQWTLSALIVGFGITQLGWGALADRWGRRPVLIFGLACYLTASVGCLLARNIEQVIALRALQGAGVAAAGVCARAVLRDLYPGKDCVRRLSIAFSWLGAVSLAGPPCAAALADLGGIDAVLGAAVLAGFCALACVLCWMPETSMPETRTSQATMPSVTCGLSAWWHIATHPVFRAYTALTTCTYCGHYLFLIGSSALLVERYGMDLLSYGWVLAAGSAMHLAGTFACRHGLSRWGVQDTVARAAGLSLLAGVAVAALALGGVHEPWAVIVPHGLFVFAHAIHQSCGQAAVMIPFPAAAATASALNGTVLPIAAATVATAMAGPLGRSAMALPLGLAVCAALTAAVAWGWVRRDGALGTAELGDTATP